MKLVLIINPAASSVTPGTRTVIERALTNGHDTKVIETQKRDHATEIAQQAVKDKVDAVVVLSGDGTVNEVANALVGTDTALAALPGGSTNVFCRSVNMTNDPVEATGILLHILAHEKPRSIGLGSANGRYFMMNVGIGFDAAVVERAERKSWIKRYAGHPYFALVALFQWSRTAAKRDTHFNVNFDNDKSVESFLTLCLNANPYTYMGTLPFDIAPEADFQRGLAVVSIHHKALPTMVGVLLTALKSGRRITRNSRVDYRPGVKHLEINSSSPFPYQVDGEFLGEVDKLVLEHHSNALRIFTPLDHEIDSEVAAEELPDDLG